MIRNTSREANERIHPVKPSIRERIKVWFLNREATVEEVHGEIGGKIQTISTRISELLRDGTLVDTGKTRRTQSGVRAHVLRLRCEHEPKTIRPYRDALHGETAAVRSRLDRPILAVLRDGGLTLTEVRERFPEENRSTICTVVRRLVLRGLVRKNGRRKVNNYSQIVWSLA